MLSRENASPTENPKGLFDVTGCTVISNCGTSTEKVSEFLDLLLQPVMKGGRSYIKGRKDFLEKLKHLSKVPPNAILVTADVVCLYHSIPYEAGFKALYEKSEVKVDKNCILKVS